MTTSPEYDLTRAALAGGFNDDMDFGRAAAQILHRTLTAWARTKTGALDKFGQLTLVDTVIVHVNKELMDEDTVGEAFWSSAMANSITDMYADLSEQIREARTLPSTPKDGTPNHG